MNFQLKKKYLEDLTFLVPVANIFEIFFLEINDRTFSIENLKIFGLTTLEEEVLFPSKPNKTDKGILLNSQSMTLIPQLRRRT
jgi:hypothetical protein